MAKLDLSTMKDEDYKKLSPVDLMKYNKSLPETDYENPYKYQPYPRMKFKKEGNEIVQAVCATAEIEKQMGPEWKDSPSEFGVETAPAAAKIPIENVRIPIPAREAIGAAPAAPEVSTISNAATRK